MIDPVQATAFLADGRVAVVGASDDPKNFGNTVLRALVDHGVEAVAVHPTAATVAGAACYPTLGAVPGDIDGVIVVVPRDRSGEVVQDCIERGVRKVWLFKGVGPGAVSDDAVRLCEDHGIEVIAGACPLMFLEPVRSVHRLHRTIRRANRSVARRAAASR